MSRHQPTRSTSPDNFKLARTLKSIESEFGHKSDGFRSSISRPPPIGHHSDDRVKRRIEASYMPPLEVIQPRSATGSRTGSREYNNRLASPSSNQFGKILSESSQVNPYDPLEKIPNARFGLNHSISDNNTSVLGSSQLVGTCQGDFCNFELSNLESGDTAELQGNLKKLNSISDFRKRLLASSGTGDEFLSQHSAISKMMASNDAESTDSRSSVSAGMLSSLEKANKTSQPLDHKITFRSIIQARQEMPLVKQQLDRHRRGDTGPYIYEDNYKDMTVGSSLPAHYYQEVPCCLNCFKVYNIVDTARAKALIKIGRKKDKKSQGKMSEHEYDEMIRADALTTKEASDYFNHSFTLHQNTELQNNQSSRRVGAASRTGSMHNVMGALAEDPEAQWETQESLRVAHEAIAGLTKMDVAEIRTMSKPPAAVEVVLEAVVILLTGKVMAFKEAHRFLGGGEAFLTLLKEFTVSNVTDERLALVEPYVDNPLFRPENVQPISFCAAKFCAWVHGIVHAARYERGLTHIRTDILKGNNKRSLEGNDNAPNKKADSNYLKPLRKVNTSSVRGEAAALAAAEELSFVQKLERMKAVKQREGGGLQMSRQGGDMSGGNGRISRGGGGKNTPSLKSISRGADVGGTLNKRGQAVRNQASMLEDASMSSNNLLSRSMGRFDPGPSPDYFSSSHDLSSSSVLPGGYDSNEEGQSSPKKTLTKREAKAMKQSQKKATDRLSAQNASEGSTGVIGGPKEFRCADGITKMPYLVMGKFSLNVQRCSFVVIHDFFDTCDATAIMFKPIVQRHEGCQAVCFNYPGQANTVWSRLSNAERDRGAKEPMLNNDFIADRLHELLKHAEESGDVLLSCPFHLVGIGNGASIAAAFCQRWGSHPLYSAGLRSLVSINGFLYPDPQLSGILHSAYQVFESTPHSRPDIPVSYWSRFVFSDDYLQKINPNLALNIYTAVSNPITNEGRSKIAKGALQHRDMRGALAPDFVAPPVRSTDNNNSMYDMRAQYRPVQVPVVMLQSTENSLVNASNVDSFLVGRNSKHLWSHMLNIPSESAMNQAFEVNAQWVGKLSSGPENYAKYSTLGKGGLKMLLDCLRNPRGAFSMWTRSGHAVHQEYKASVLDLLDALACPTDEYVGFSPNETANLATTSSLAQQSLMELTTGGSGSVVVDEPSVRQQSRIVFRLEPPKVADTLGTQSTVVAATPIATEESTHIDEEEESVRVVANASSIDIESYLNRVPEERKPTVNTATQESVEVENEEVQPYEEEVVGEALNASVAEMLSNSEIVHRPSYGEGDLDAPPVVTTQQSTNKSGKVKTAAAIAATPNPVNLNELYASTRPDVPLANGATEVPIKTVGKAVSKKRLDFATETRNKTSVKDIDSITADDDILSITDAKPHTSTQVQRSRHEWTQNVPDAAGALELEAQLRAKQKEYQELEEKLKRMRESDEAARLDRLEDAQSNRRQQFDKEDKKLLKKLQKEVDERQKERLDSEKQRRVEMQEIEAVLVTQGVVPDARSSTLFEGMGDIEPMQMPVQELAPQRYEAPTALPRMLTEAQDVVSKLDRMLADEEDARKKGIMSMEQYETVKSNMVERQLERDQMLRQLTGEEQLALYEHSSVFLQKLARGFVGRRRAARAALLRKQKREQTVKVIKIQAQMRRFMGCKRFNYIKNIYLNNMKSSFSATELQRVYRGHADRRYFKKLRRWVNAINVQRAFRGHLGRVAAKREKTRLEMLRRKQFSAAKIQSVWRMKVAKEEFRSLRIHILACVEVQRMYRGYLGRKKMFRRKQWETAAPGPERIKLGLQFIEESKQAFERQQEEIDALHRAQERAEARVSHIHSELKESEKELVVLERELQEIDQIERDLSTLTHERNLLVSGIEDATGMPRTAAKGHKDLISGKESNRENDPIIDRRRKAEAYALEMTIQIKRAEREKKRQELEIEFAAVFQEVEKKRKALSRLEMSLLDMEATRERKDREFRRLQKNLMQLLLEQKQELDDLREKGIELETATATTAAAAVATAQKAKEHEKRSTAMFSQTEELMKFQFMSMSLSYFSSLNMLKSLRDMNSDTTSAAISMSADAAATAASAAAAANLPNMKKLSLGADDFIEGAIQRKKNDLVVAEKAEKDYNKAAANPMSENVRTWTVSDVARWLDSLYLNQYADAFVEASVDGPFLMELREEDLVQVLGIKHKLHVRKILISREKLKPLSQQEKANQAAVEREDGADNTRKEIGMPSLDTVFSQARNGRIKRVEESLNMGFAIDAEDERGNTLLLVASQNSNKKLVEMLLVRGAAINHQNAQGNTALHFALAFGSEGQLGEYLIEHGADDTIENIEGMTPYDGVAG